MICFFSYQIMKVIFQTFSVVSSWISLKSCQRIWTHQKSKQNLHSQPWWKYLLSIKPLLSMAYWGNMSLFILLFTLKNVKHNFDLIIYSYQAVVQLDIVQTGFLFLHLDTMLLLDAVAWSHIPAQLVFSRVLQHIRNQKLELPQVHLQLPLIMVLPHPQLHHQLLHMKTR